MADDQNTIPPEEIDPPPEAPEIGRKTKLPPTHAAGVAILGLIVLLAASGLFGESRGTTGAAGDSLSLSVEYPTRFRYKRINPMQVFVTNLSSQRLDTVTVAFDTAYISRFSNFTFTPSASKVWEVQLAGVGVAETRG